MSKKKPLAALPVLLPKAPANQLKIKIERTSGKPTGLQISVQGQASRQVYAMLPGSLYYLHPGNIAFGYKFKRPAVFLETVPMRQLSKWSAVAPIPQFIIIENISPTSLRKDLAREDGPLGVYSKRLREALFKDMGLFSTALLIREEVARRAVPNRRVRRSTGVYVGTGAKTGTVYAGKPLVVRFAHIGRSGKLELMNPLPFLKVLSTVDKTLAAHPLVKFAQKQSEQLAFHFRFEYWSTHHGKYQVVDWSPKVTLSFENGGIQKGGRVNANGKSSFIIRKSNYQKALNKKLHFEITSRRSAISGVKLPATWTTVGKYDIYGNPLWFDKFPGISIGTSKDPVVIRIMDAVRLRLQYVPKGTTRPSPLSSGVKVNVKSPNKSTLRTDGSGQIIWPYFSNPPTKLELEIEGEMQDKSLKLPSTTVYVKKSNRSTQKQLRWDISLPIAPRRIATLNPLLTHTIRADTRHPNDIMRDKSYYIRLALYHLKIVQEVHRWLQFMTLGAWKGEELFMVLQNVPGHHTEASFQKRFLFIDNEYHWSRRATAHEFGHRVMADLLEITGNAGKKKLAVKEKYISPHWPNMISQRTEAFTEGWAEFFGLAFGSRGNGAHLNPSSRLSYPTGTPSAKQRFGRTPTLMSHVDLGEIVEGAFADALWHILKSQVLDPRNRFFNDYVHESTNGDIFSAHQSNLYYKKALSATQRRKFVKYFWKPMQALRSNMQAGGKGVNSREYWNAIKQNVSSTEWNRIHRSFRVWNIARRAYRYKYRTNPKGY